MLDASLLQLASVLRQADRIHRPTVEQREQSVDEVVVVADSVVLMAVGIVERKVAVQRMLCHPHHLLA